jgi:type II restriction enzyme
MKEIEKPLLTAAGLSDKALNYFQDEDKTKAIEELVTNFLEPAGSDFVDEVVYRYLLIKGDSLGGSMRNIVGSLGQQKLIRSFLAILRLQNISYQWLANSAGAQWADTPEDETIVEQGARAIAWQNENGTRVLAFNMTIPLVRKNIDICLFDATTSTYNGGKVCEEIDKTILLGELKAGIDPAGADEHWKTANSALRRITDAYTAEQHPVKTVFIGAAIERAMAKEIYDQLTNNLLTNAANLSDEEQMVEVCNWIARI